MQKVNKRNKWCLSLGCIGRDLCYTLVSLFLLTYIQYTGLVNSKQFLVLSAIIVICRIWDAINDPMMGTIITNTKTKFGKYRPWVLIGAVTNSIVLILLFTVRFSSESWANVVFIGVMYLLWGMTFTMNDISYWDLLPALATEKKDRDSLTTFVAVFASLGAFISGGLIPILTPGRMVMAYRIYSIIAALVFLGCQLMVFFGVHDNKEDTFIDAHYQDEKMEEKDKVSFKGMVKILFSNKQLLVMAVVVLLYSLGSAILNAFGQNFFYFRFGYLEGKSGISGGTMMTIFTVIYGVGTLLSQSLYPRLASKWSRQKLINFAIIFLAIGYIFFFIFANLKLGSDLVSFIILSFIGLFIFAGQGVFYLTMLVMLTNTIEYGEWQTGENNAAITFTVRPFMVKLAGAIQYGVVAITLLACGLVTITNKVGNIEAAMGMLKENASFDYIAYLKEYFSNEDILKITEQINLNGDVTKGLQAFASSLFVSSTFQMIGLTAVMCIVPIILFVIAWIVIKKKYIINEQMYEKITQEIAARNNQNS